MTDRNTGKRNNGDIDQPENDTPALFLHLSITTLRINGLNPPFKRQSGQVD